MTKEQRLAVANTALKFFAPDTSLSLDGKGRVRVSWTNYKGETTSRQWQTRGQDFYPSWYRKWAHGGTCSTALSQLVRWVQGKPVLPMSTWQWWVSETVYLARPTGPEQRAGRALLRSNAAAFDPGHAGRRAAGAALRGDVRPVRGGQDQWLT